MVKFAFLKNGSTADRGPMEERAEILGNSGLSKMVIP